MKIKQWFHRVVDWKRDERGFVLRLFLSEGYVEISLDKPTKDFRLQVLYGETSPYEELS